MLYVFKLYIERNHYKKIMNSIMYHRLKLCWSVFSWRRASKGELCFLHMTISWIMEMRYHAIGERMGHPSMVSSYMYSLYISCCQSSDLLFYMWCVIGGIQRGKALWEWMVHKYTVEGDMVLQLYGKVGILAQELIIRGHDVVVLDPDMEIVERLLRPSALVS